MKRERLIDVQEQNGAYICRHGDLWNRDTGQCPVDLQLNWEGFSVQVFAQTVTFSPASCHVFDWSSSRDNTRPNRLIHSPINHRKDSVHLQSLVKDKRSIFFFFFLKSGKRLKGDVVHTYCAYCTYPLSIPSVSHTEARVQGYSKYTRSNKA